MKRFTRKEKAAHWRRWKQSGLTQSRYCKTHGLKPSSFKNWGKALVDYPLVPVQIQAPSVVGFQLQCGQIVIELPAQMSREQWRQLLSALKEPNPC